MDVLVLIGRVLFVILFFSSAVGHLTQTKGMAQYAGSKGVPYPELAVRASGVLMAVGALMVLLGIWPDIGALLLFIYLLPTAVLMHNFWAEQDPGARQQTMIQFNKDLALAGASLMLFALFAYTGDDLGLSFVRPAFGFH